MRVTEYCPATVSVTTHTSEALVVPQTMPRFVVVHVPSGHAGALVDDVEPPAPVIPPLPILPPAVPTLPVLPPVPPTTALPPVPGRGEVETPPVLVDPPVPVVDTVPVPFKGTVKPEAMLSVAVAAPT